MATRLFSEMRMISVFGHSTVTKGRELFAREATSLFRSVPFTLTPAQSVVRSPLALHFLSQHCTHAGADSASTEITERGFTRWWRQPLSSATISQRIASETFYQIKTAAIFSKSDLSLCFYSDCDFSLSFTVGHL